MIIINDYLSNSHGSPLSRLLGFTIWSLPISVSRAWSYLDDGQACAWSRENGNDTLTVCKLWVCRRDLNTPHLHLPQLSGCCVSITFLLENGDQTWVNGRTSRAENWWNLELEYSFQEFGNKKAGILGMGYEETMNWFQPRRKTVWLLTSQKAWNMLR